MNQNRILRRGFRTVVVQAVAALALAGLAGGLFAGPARADDWRHHEGYEHHDHGRHRGRDRHHERVVVAPRPAVVYAPPPVRVYAPPPVVYTPPPPPPGISLIFPIEIR